MRIGYAVAIHLVVWVLTRTYTQPLSELATVSVGCAEVPEPISGRRRCIWGSCHLQTVHTSDHYDLVVHGTNLYSTRRLVCHLQTSQRVKCN